MALRLALAAMATRFELVLDDGDGTDGGASLRAAGEAALDEIAEVERTLSRFRNDALPARIERAGATQSARDAGVPLARDEIVLLELCRRAFLRTEGAFDPGHGGSSFSNWRIDRRCRRVFAPEGAGRIDLGAIGKGHALDLAVRALVGAGVTRALLHGGTSSVAAMGAPPGRAAWRIALRDSIATVDLRDRALSVSGAEHVVDPRDGAPVERARLAAVVARHGAVAEAWSTALLVLAERRLRRGQSVTAATLRLPRSVSALVAWEEDGAPRTAVFGPDAGLFALRSGARPLQETSR